VSVDSFMSRLNPMVVALLRSPLHWIASPGLTVLSYTARKCGKRVTIPVGYQIDGDVVGVLVSEARRKRWWRNFREPGPVDLHLRGRARHGRGALVSPDDDYFRAAVEEVLRRVPAMDRVFKVDFDQRTGLTDEQLARLGVEIAVVRIELDPVA